MEGLLGVLALVIIVLAFVKQLKDDKKKAKEWAEKDPEEQMYE